MSDVESTGAAPEPNVAQPSEHASAPARGLHAWWERVTCAREPVYLTRWLFMRLLAVVYAVAFLSCWVQARGLIGHDGILPADAYLTAVLKAVGARGYWYVPSLFWLYPHDVALDVLCAGGVACAALVIVGIAPVPALAMAWVCYLSLVSIGQEFLTRYAPAPGIVARPAVLPPDRAG